MIRFCCTLALILLPTSSVFAQTPAPTPVPVGGKLVWDQPAAALATAQSHVYRLYKDNVQVGPIAGVVCTAPVAATPTGMFPCSATFPADTPGVSHTIQITAALPDGTVESAPSVVFMYLFRVVPLTPRNVRSGQ